MLREGALGADKVAHAMEVIERSARSQAQLIEDLLDVSRIVSGKMRLQVRPVLVAPVKVRLLSAGFQAHIPKPPDAAELITVNHVPRAHRGQALKRGPGRRASRLDSTPAHPGARHAVLPA